MSATGTSSQPIEVLYGDHHGWLRGWLRKRLGNAFDAADLAHDTYVRILASGSMPQPDQSRRHLTQIANGQMCIRDSCTSMPTPRRPTGRNAR